MILSMTSSSNEDYKIVIPAVLDVKERVETYSLKRHTGTDLPVEAYWGTVYMGNGESLLECYSYFDPNFKPAVYYTKGWTQKIISVRFIKLARLDKIYFNKWEDFDLYDTEHFHTFIKQLQKYGFRVLLKNK